MSQEKDFDMQSLKMHFFLKVEDNFFSESEIYQELQNLKVLASKGKIDLHTTDGAVSIQYYDQELLGIDLWDEINLVIDFLFHQMDKFFEIETISNFMPMQSCWIKLTMQGDFVLYELESKVEHRPINLKVSLPLNEFLEAFTTLYIKMIRILAELGSSSFSETSEELVAMLHPKLIEKIGRNRIEGLVNTPLASLLTDGKILEQP